LELPAAAGTTRLDWFFETGIVEFARAIPTWEPKSEKDSNIVNAIFVIELLVIFVMG
jgi:hypothetical protein